jgi:carboxyl-terminal processing protease
MGRYEKEEYVVTGVLDGSPAAVAGILVGDRLKSVQGEPFRTIQSFREMEGKSLSLSYTRGNENRTTSVIPKKENILRAFLDATRKSARTYVVNGKKIGYVHLWTMGHDLFKQLLDQIVLGELHSTDGLILDLRDGFGGNPWGFSEAFFTPDVEWQQDTRGAKIIRRIGYGKPMVVLTNAGTRSAKEFLAYQFKKTGRAILVGTNTAGAFLGATGFPLKQGLYLEIPIVGLSLDGKRLEAKGVAPDIVVEAQAPYTEQDAQLQKAKETLLTRMTRRLTVQN